MRFLDYALLALLALGVFFAIRKMVKRKQEGSFCGCGGSCAGCSGCARAQNSGVPQTPKH